MLIVKSYCNVHHGKKETKKVKEPGGNGNQGQLTNKRITKDDPQKECEISG